MKDETRDLVVDITERVRAAHAGGRHDLQRVLDTATAATMVLGADGGEDCAVMARLVRTLMLGVSSTFQSLKVLEDDLRARSQTHALANEIGRMWGNPSLRPRAGK